MTAGCDASLGVSRRIESVVRLTIE